MDKNLSTGSEDNHGLATNEKSGSEQAAKQKLVAEREHLLGVGSRLEETGIGDTMADSIGELSVYDNHPADLGDELFERSKDIALRDNAHVLLDRVEAALDKIEEGSYGICDRCGKEIDPERLEALPSATHCLHCQQEIDSIDPTPRPLEEEVLAPPFHRTFLDTANFDNVGFDGEDALQAVMKYGSSDTPQDIPGTKNYDDVWPNSNEHPGIVEYSDAIPNDLQSTRSERNKKEAEKRKRLKRE